MDQHHEQPRSVQRRQLPLRRHAITFSTMFWNQPWHISVGFYEDGFTPGEVFATPARTPGTDLDAMARDGAILFSLCLQYGVPPDVIRGALTRNPDGSPSAITGLIADRIASIGPKI
jgi:ribonucleoside-diphosphate reductase alpha chain